MKNVFILLSLLFIIVSCATNKDKEKNAVLEITHKAVFETNMGKITVGLYGNAMPETVANFVSYLKKDFYAGLIFHRVIPGFVIQGGGFLPDMHEKQTQPPIKLEHNTALKHEKYMLAMARTNYPHSATSQFYITLAQLPRLDYNPAITVENGYAVFGIVLEGQDTVEKIGKVPTQNVANDQNVPIEPVIIKKSYITEEKKAESK